MPESGLERSLVVLASSGADFVVIGGLAVLLHGGAYLTYDLDVPHARTRENARLIAAALAPFRPRPVDWPEELPFVWDDETVMRASILMLDTDVGRIDLLAEPAGAPSYSELKSKAQVVEIGGVGVHVASIDDLISMKRAAGRPKDLAATAELESLKKLRGESED